MDLEYTGFIPETYVQNPQTKMEIYKKIAAITTDNEFENVVFELEDRFGPIPEEVLSLLALAEIRIICKKGSTKTTIDSKRLKSERPEIYEEYSKTSTSSPSISMEIV